MDPSSRTFRGVARCGAFEHGFAGWAHAQGLIDVGLEIVEVGLHARQDKPDVQAKKVGVPSVFFAHRCSSSKGFLRFCDLGAYCYSLETVLFVKTHVQDFPPEPRARPRHQHESPATKSVSQAASPQWAVALSTPH